MTSPTTPPAATTTTTPPAPTTTFAEAVASLRARLTPATLAEVGSVYAFHFSDDGTSATLDGSGTQRGFVEAGPAALGLTPDFEVTLTRADFAQLVTGQLHPMAGMATGRLRLRGSMRQAIKLDRILKS